MKSTTYKKSGVNIAKADVFIKGLSRLFPSKETSRAKAFASTFDLAPVLKKYNHPLLVSSSDGVGTKLILAQQLNSHFSVGIDLVAMNVNDIICMGAKPLLFLDYIACGKLKPQVMLDVAKGIKKGLELSECILCGGETAEMPGMYGADDYDLAGFCVGIVDKKNIIDGRSIRKGDLVLGIESSGPHSNGFSLIRKVFSQKDIKKY
ncbi:MAG: phosphoribosylformylglycinamidine cyclo-ligase, partial [Candidatus Omnitrophica bacterium]|nr:phosphoribosylformylglycinamidine cyclo-ligase [Candidatus Omnitrophota bacterium]